MGVSTRLPLAGQAPVGRRIGRVAQSLACLRSHKGQAGKLSLALASGNSHASQPHHRFRPFGLRTLTFGFSVTNSSGTNAIRMPQPA